MPPLFIAVPVWGEWYTNVFIRATLPSIREAIEYANGDARILIFTDGERDYLLRSLMAGMNVQFGRVPSHENNYERMGKCHRIALDHAKPGDAVFLMCADQVVSREAFGLCQRKLDEGKKAVMCVGPRTLAEPTQVPIGISGRELLAWSISNWRPR